MENMKSSPTIKDVASEAVEAIVKSCVEYVLSDQQLLPSLIQIPVSYAFGGTTKS